MELQKLKCSDCGAPIEVPPGMKHVRCAHCGASYEVIRNSDSSGGGYVPQNVKDNPVSVTLEPTHVKEIGFKMLYPAEWDHLYDLLSDHRTYYDPFHKQSCGFYLDEFHQEDFDLYVKYIDKKVHSYAIMSMLTGESYHLSIAHFLKDKHLLYKKDPRRTPAFPKAVHRSEWSDSLISDAVEPEKLVEKNFNENSDSAEAVYPKKRNEESNRGFERGLAELLKRPGYTSDEVIRFAPEKSTSTEKIGWFGSSHYYYWTLMYTDVEVKVDVTPALADLILSRDEIEHANRMKENPSILSICERLCSWLNDFSQYQLNTRFTLSPRLVISKFGIRIETGPVYQRVYEAGYGEFSMDSIPDDDTHLIAQAVILAVTDGMLKNAGLPRWQIVTDCDHVTGARTKTALYDTRHNYKWGSDYRCDFVLACDTKAVAKFNAW